MPASFLNELSAFSARIGKNPLLVQAAGGNTSYKQEDTLHIKASGTWLKDAEHQNIFIPLKLSQVQNALNRCQENIDDAVIEKTDKRPSIETFLHALIPHTVVVHVHSINVIAASIIANGQQEILQKLSDMQVFFIPYERPGLPLALKIKKAVKNIDASLPLVLILENHGLLIGANSIVATEKLLDEVEQKLTRVARPLPNIFMREKYNISLPSFMQISYDPLIGALSHDATCAALAKLGPLYPDHVVFLGAVPIVYSPPKSFEKFLATLPKDTLYAILPNTGVLLNINISESAVEMLKAWANTLLRLSIDDNIHALPSDEINKLLHWDAEAFRLSQTRK